MNIGTALFVNSDAGAGAIGIQGSANGISADPSTSLFQQLISQMLAGKGLAVDAAGENLLGGAPGETDGTLSELLLAGGNLTRLKLQNAEQGISGLTAVSGEQKEEAKSDGINGAKEAILAMMGGLIQPVPVSDSNTAIIQEHGPAIANIGNIVSAIATGGKNPVDKTGQKTVLGNEDGSALQGIGLTEETAGQKTALTGADKTSTDGGRQTATSGETFAALTGIDSQTASASGQADPRNALQTAFQKIQDSELAADTGNGKKEGIAAQSDKSSDSVEIQVGSQFVPGTGAPGMTEQNPSISSVEKAEPYSQIGDEILAKLEQKGPMEFKMQLEPEDLGQIDINLKLSEGKLIIDILAANAKTQALLTSQVDKLISSMGLQNVQVENVQVNQQMNSQSQYSQNQNFSMNAGMDFSQRGHQGQYQEEFYKSAGLTGTFGLRQNETQDSGTTSRIESFRYDSHRMNYAV